jgi:CysZ protein
VIRLSGRTFATSPSSGGVPVFSDFLSGLTAHVRGIRFALARKGYLGLAVIPFVLTSLLFAVGFSLFATHSDQFLAYFWSPDQAQTTGALLGALYWLYAHVVKYLLYLLSFVLMYFLFMVAANILAAPLYDLIAGRLAREARGGGTLEPTTGISVWRTVIEETKKALFVVVLPLVLVFIPVVGQILAPLAAAWLLAYDFVDFSLCRDTPRFADRLRFAARRPLLLLGFGLPLLVPILNLVLYPFAILGSSLAYHDTLGRPVPTLPKK